MIGTTGVALDFIYQGIAKNRISLAPLSATQALLQDGKIPTRIKIIRAFCPVYN
jgi:hypothetical protein